MTSQRPLRQVAKRVLALNPEDPDLVMQIRALQDSAKMALAGAVPGRENAPHLEMARKRAADVRRAEADERAKQLRPVIANLRKGGKTSYREIAEALDALGFKPPRNHRWAVSTVRMIEQGGA